MRRAKHDRRCASKENSITAAHDGLFVKGITETKTWSKVVAVANRRRSVQPSRSQSSARIVHARVSHILQVVTQAKIQSELRSHAPIVLHEESILLEIGIRGPSGSSCAGKILSEGRWCVRSKQCVRVESELTAEQPREEVEHTIEIQVSTKFQTVIPARVTNDVDKLHALDGRFTGAEIVSSELQETAAGLNTRFRDVAVRFARFAVASKLKTKVVDQAGS